MYRLGLRLAALANPKARLWVDGRRNWAENLRKAMGSEKTPLVWMHCASLGEFEQGRPLLEELRKNASAGSTEKLKIVLTFFSPSGYEVMHRIVWELHPELYGHFAGRMKGDPMEVFGPAKDLETGLPIQAAS